MNRLKTISSRTVDLLLGLLFVAVSVPLLSGRWWWDPDGEWPIELWSNSRVALAAAALFLLLAALRKRRLLGLVVYIFGLVSVTILIDYVRAGPTAIAVTVVLLSIVCSEAIHQNRSLFVRLRDKGHRIGPLLCSTTKLWWPMIGAIAVGIYLNLLLVDAAKSTVYSATPIDRYCKILSAASEKDERQTLSIAPCTELGDLLNDQGGEIRRIELIDALDDSIRRKFLARKMLISGEFSLTIQHLELGRVTRTEALARLLDVTMNVHYVPGLLGIGLDGNLAETMMRADPKLNELKAEKRSLEIEFNEKRDLIGPGSGTHAGPTSKAGRLMEVRRIAEKIREIDEAIRLWQTKIQQEANWIEFQNLDGATKALTSHIPNNLQLAESRILFLANIAMRKAHDNTLTEESNLDRDELLALLVAAHYNTIKGLDELEDLTITRIQRFFDALSDPSVFSHPLHPDLIAALSDEEAVYSFFNIRPQCSTQKESDGVMSTADYESVDRPTNRAAFEAADKVAINREWFDCPEGGIDSVFELEELDFWESIDRSIVFLESENIRRIEDSFRELSKQSYESAEEAQRAAREQFNRVNSDLDLGRESCYYFTPPGHCIANIFKAKAEDEYNGTVRSLRAKANEQVAEKTTAGAQSIERQALAARSAMYESVDRQTAMLRNSVRGLNSGTQVFAAVMNLLLGLAIIKSFLYVLATEVFNKNMPALIQLTDEKLTQGHFSTTTDLIVPADFTASLVTKAPGDNQDKSITLWPIQAAKAVVARIWSGCYWLNKGGHTLKNEDMVFSGSKDRYFVDWQMREGEQVILGFRNFFGMSDNVKFKTIVSLHLSTLLLSRFVFHSAFCPPGSGEGKLILINDRKGVSDDSKVQPVTLDRVVAWNAHTTFQIYSDRSKKSVFVDGYTIGPVRDKKSGTGLVLTRATAMSTGLFSVMGRFARTFLTPI